MNIYGKNEIDKLAWILKNDGVISVPTDTVYGLCASINSEKAYKKLINVKNRPKNKFFPIMFKDLDQIKNICLVDKKIEKLINQFMPGPITFILNKKHDIIISEQLSFKTIAVRMATSLELQELISKVGCPIFMTSANISGHETCKSISEIESVLPNIDGILEGNISYGQASTIVDCTSDEIRIQREGPITLEQILEILKG